MVHTGDSDKYIHFALMYTACNIFPILPIKHFVIQYGEPTTPNKLATGTKPSVSNIHVLFCPCVVHKATAHVDTNVLNIHHQPQKGFWSISVVITQHQKG